MIRDHRVYKPNKQKGKLRIISFIGKIFFMTLLVYIVITGFFLSSYVVDSVSMEPVLKKGDRVFVTPLGYGFFTPFSTQKIGGFQKPKRGEIVLIKVPFTKTTNSQFLFLNSFLPNKDTANGHYLKRIIGIPGDTIKLENFIAYIKPSGRDQFIQEKDLIKNQYETIISGTINIHEWEDKQILSGNLNEIVLKENEYFVLGDNRTLSNDSRVWGGVSGSQILCKVVLRYFPFSRIAIPR